MFVHYIDIRYMQPVDCVSRLIRIFSIFLTIAITISIFLVTFFRQDDIIYFFSVFDARDVN